jgi:hypothetical protein
MGRTPGSSRKELPKPTHSFKCSWSDKAPLRLHILDSQEPGLVIIPSVNQHGNVEKSIAVALAQPVVVDRSSSFARSSQLPGRPQSAGVRRSKFTSHRKRSEVGREKGVETNSNPRPALRANIESRWRRAKMRSDLVSDKRIRL